MKIIDNKLTKDDEDVISIKFQASPNYSEHFTNKPSLIIVHYTAGASLESSANWLCNPQVKASAHIIIGKNGNIIQLVPFNKKAWHAGKSKWESLTNINKYSIGIEMDNAGKLSKRVDGYYTSFNKKIDDQNVVLAKHKFGNQEEAWEAYTQEQINSFINVCNILIQSFPIERIIGHEDIAPDRKTDPGPALSLLSLEETILNGRKDIENTDQLDRDAKLQEATVTAPFLNIRSRASINAPIVNNPLKAGTKLKIIKYDNNWSLVSFNIQGWVNNKWIRKK